MADSEPAQPTQVGQTAAAKVIGGPGPTQVMQIVYPIPPVLPQTMAPLIIGSDQPVAAVATTRGGPAPAQMTNEMVTGNPPRMFDGARNKSATFLQDFNIYRELNSGAPQVAIPYRRVMFALSFIRGPNVDDWVNDQRNALTTKTEPPTAIMDKEDERLWTEFMAAFSDTFVNISGRLDAFNQFKALKMKEDDLGTYVTQFKQLAAKLRYDLNERRTIDRFIGGLWTKLQQKITKRVKLPHTFNEWIAAAQEELQLMVLRARLDSTPNEDVVGLTRNTLELPSKGSASMSGPGATDAFRVRTGLTDEGRIRVSKKDDASSSALRRGASLGPAPNAETPRQPSPPRRITTEEFDKVRSDDKDKRRRQREGRREGADGEELDKVKPDDKDRRRRQHEGRREGADGEDPCNGQGGNLKKKFAGFLNGLWLAVWA